LFPSIHASVETGLLQTLGTAFPENQSAGSGFMLAQMDWQDVIWLPNAINHPMVLWAMAVPVVILIWIWHRRSNGVAIPVDHSQHGSGMVARVLIDSAESLKPLLLALVVFLLAGPLVLGKPTEKRSVTNIQFCVDISGSMTAKFGEGSRYDASMNAINQFLDFREGDAFGLSFFGNSVLHWCPLTTDSSAIRCSIPFMRPETAPPWFGGTEIGKALLACRRLLMEQDEGDRMIILVSDGSSSDLSGGNAVEIARRIANEGIVVYGIHIADYDVPDEIVTLTNITGGEVFNPGDEEALAAVFQRIDSMQKAEVEQTIAEQLDHYRPYAFLGLLLLGISVLCSYGLRYTPW
jgi:Ca-activated chloride channel family protein